ncbi:uncharacterized protein LOC133321537 [Musca vetustissima]|uniref:uncharacterized protein LOC133321537 n=1 Tax=Musca vetustissima TaxID=27455 RepID=UPI002AB61BE5|nr:uncharacterized protein LOC133321537 [Musca vetustissima]
MRGFFIIVLFAVANAEKLGYTYSAGGSTHGFGNRFKHRGRNATPATTSAPTPTDNGAATGNYIGPGGYAADTVAREQYQSVESRPEFNKEFYSYAAPEEEFNDIDGSQRLAATMRKNLRVVFIKTPENHALENAALQLAKHTAESKTAIYVLSKQPDIAELANKLKTVQQNSNEKPEVHFVKYRTPEDAVRAQQIIQQEYDSLGGTSRYSNEGVAPVLDFASINEGLLSDKASGFGNPSSVTANGYLPPKVNFK